MPKTDRFLIIVAIAFAVVGVFCRVYPFSGQSRIGHDEHVYDVYVDRLSQGASYRALIRAYIHKQPQVEKAFLPPTRVSFLSAADLLTRLTGQAPIKALQLVSLSFGILTVAAATAFAWRAGGVRVACGVLALMSAAPLQIHLSHRALIDGFFAFWALLCLWMLWEALRQPRQRRWLFAYGAALALLVMTKENAAFVFIGILAIIALNRWLNFGEVTSSLLVTTLVAPALAVLLLMLLFGGGEAFFHTYLLNIQKSYLLDYAIKTGDGPWYRYLLDLFTVSPLLMLLACGGLLQTRREDSWPLFLAIFLLVTYAVMANLRYGMNLRYGAIWDLPLRCFAFAQLGALTAWFSERTRPFVLPGLLAVVCLVDLRQYFVLFLWGAIYDPIPVELLRVLQILK